MKLYKFVDDTDDIKPCSLIFLNVFIIMHLTLFHSTTDEAHLVSLGSLVDFCARSKYQAHG